jgi:hypothetical protein
MIWVALVRVPLILNAEVHLDSDLAVDGLTLLDALHGHWRWHFPGTPQMGTPPVLLAMPGAMIFGANAVSLVVGCVIGYEAVVLATFVLAFRVFGPRVAAWSLVPLAFASIGTVWLSGRMTGGHLLTVAWHASALAILHGLLTTRRVRVALLLGLWCGFGLYLDRMFLATLFVAVPIALLAALSVPGVWRKIAAMAALVVGFLLGVSPREVGMQADPHDAYQGQFDTILEPDQHGPSAGKIDPVRVRLLLREHARLLLRECLPRLIAGHRLSSLDLPTETEPSSLPRVRGFRPPTAIPFATVAISSILFVASILGLFLRFAPERGAAPWEIRWALLTSSAIVTAGFLVSTNIYNSDNYRYLVFWLVPWSVGFGRVMEFLSRRGLGGKIAAVVLAVGLAIATAMDVDQWYRGLGWIDDRSRPVRRSLDDAALVCLQKNPGITAFYGGYWDVYRLQFLLGGRPQGVPYPVYPDRFDAVSSFPGRRPTVLVARRNDLNGFYYRLAASEGRGTYLDTDALRIVEWPLP